MLKHILKEAAQRLVTDTARLGRGLLPPIDAATAANAAARALSRNWVAATALAEITAARWSASPPTHQAPSGPFRILFATRFGALSPSAELTAVALLGALEGALDIPRERPVSLSLCATRAVAAPSGPDSDSSLRLFRHTVLDATEVAASDVAAWVAAHDIVLTSTDFGVDSTPADVELAAMALGFARARGVPAVAIDVASAPAAMQPDARAFLQRFAKKARFAATRTDTAHALAAAGFVTVAPPALAARPPQPQPAPNGQGPVLLVARALPDAAVAPSPLSELVGLGQLLVGRAPPAAPQTPPPAAAAERLRAHGVPFTCVSLGRGASPWPASAPSIHLDDGAALDAWCKNLPADAVILADSIELHSFFGLRGRRIATPAAWLADAASADTPQSLVPPVPVGAWLEPLLPPRLGGPPRLGAPQAGDLT